ncbi:MAG: 23S rRNA pseudouridine synthase F, partial [Flavobacteriaceae bacterium]|nr:23S rRNA pseudouridine synthase F [Flavobacteriaceae bacterium]
TLKRVRIMNITLDTPVGEYRELTAKEMAELDALLVDSVKTFDASRQPRNKRKEH